MKFFSLVTSLKNDDGQFYIFSKQSAPGSKHSSKRVSRSGGGVEDPPCFKIGLAVLLELRAEKCLPPQGSLRVDFDDLSVGVYPWLPTRVMVNSDWLRYGVE